MTRPIYADIPKFKAVERQLRQILRGQVAAMGKMQSARATPYERQCLDAAGEECQKATERIRQALGYLYQAFDRPAK